MTKVLIFGNGQMSEIAHVYLSTDSPFEVVGFCVDKNYIREDIHRGLPVFTFEDIQETHPPSDYAIFAPMGPKRMNRLRAEKYNQVKDMGYDFVTYISSRATVCPEVEIGENCFILENNVIQPFVKIGNNVILWSGNHIGHHSIIMDHCFLASHIVVSGKVKVEAYCYFGVNATIRDEITIKESCVIGAGAVIMKSTKEKEVYRGLMSKPHSVTSDSINII